jgi:chromosome segregation ATPase
MQSATETRTSQEWEGVIADFTAKARACDGEVADLVRDRNGLALDAELGIDGAARRLQKIASEITAKQQAAQTLRTAIGQAQSRRDEARVAEAAGADQQRHAQIAAHLEQYLSEVRSIDEALSFLTARFQAATQAMNRAETLMTGTERQPIQQLRSLFGPTLAAAHVGLGEHLQLGPLASNVIHRQPLERFAMGFVDRWVRPGETEAA